jgi:biotin synthase-like enzyme
MGEASIRAAIRAEAAKHTLIATAFEAFAKMVYPDAPPDQMREKKVCFMAGAAELFSCIMTALDPGGEPTEADMAMMDSINAELEAFHTKTITTASARGLQ